MGTYFILFACLLVSLAFFIPKIFFVKVSGHGIVIGFNENTYGKGVCILVRAYAPVHLHLFGSDFLVSHNMVIDYPGQALYTKRI